MQQEEGGDPIKPAVNAVQQHSGSTHAEWIYGDDGPCSTAPRPPGIPGEKKDTWLVAAKTLNQEQQTERKNQQPVDENGNADAVRVPWVITSGHAHKEMSEDHQRRQECDTHGGLYESLALLWCIKRVHSCHPTRQPLVGAFLSAVTVSQSINPSSQRGIRRSCSRNR